MRSACISGLYRSTGDAEYIPRVPRFGWLDVAEPRGVPRGTLTLPSSEQSPTGAPGRWERTVHGLLDRTAKSLVQSRLPEKVAIARQGNARLLGYDRSGLRLQAWLSRKSCGRATLAGQARSPAMTTQDNPYENSLDGARAWFA